ncbi:MAG TPA: chemotaxis response regulator protein-glutamate methylesterase [Patescibacteria group bacterium]
MKIRVLIVDDSFFMRKLIAELLSEHPKIEVIDDASDGPEAVEKAVKLKPNVITMDYRMPGLDGAKATEKILAKVEPPPAIIMLSAYTKEGAEETLNSLKAGAVDFIAKPSGELSLDINKIKQELVTKVIMAAQARVIRRTIKSVPKKVESRERQPVKRTSAAKVIVLGASTGGPPIIEDILVGLPANLNSSVLIVQHMPEHFTESFARRLAAMSNLQVREAANNDVIKTSLAFVARGGYHMIIKKRTAGQNIERLINLTQAIPEWKGFRPSIDILMESVAENFGREVVGVLLTGMGEDGRQGMRSIKEARGYTIVQEPDTAVVDSMPKSVIKDGVADEVLPPDHIARRIIELVQ